MRRNCNFDLFEETVKGLKAHANGCNKCQQLPTLLGVVGQQCCVRLHGPKSLTGFKLQYTQHVPGSANIVVDPCKWTQQVTTLLGPTMLGVVGQQCWVRCMDLKVFISREPELWSVEVYVVKSVVCVYERQSVCSF